MPKGSIAVRIAGKEYRIRSDDDEASLQRVASHVDGAMQKIRDRTGTVDTLDVAILASLNLARELIELREGPARAAPDTGRLRAVIDLAESAVPAS